MIKYFKKNTKGNDYVVGDIHGAYDELSNSLEDIGFDESVDRLFCVGDLIDRGDRSAAFIKWLQYPWFHSVRGNHEDLLIGNYEDDPGKYHCHIANGGLWYEDCSPDLRKKMYEVCLDLPYIIEVETEDGLVGILHADTGTCNDWEEFKSNIEQGDDHAREVCLWSRMRVATKMNEWVNGVSKIYVGHTPLHTDTTYGNIHFIDTGACFDVGHFTIKRL